jgi:hypothetical protein
MLPYQTMANEFLYCGMISAFGEDWKAPFYQDWRPYWRWYTWAPIDGEKGTTPNPPGMLPR